MWKVLPFPKDVQRKLFIEYLNETDRMLFFQSFEIGIKLKRTYVHIINASSNNHLETLKWLVDHNFPRNSNAAAFAASNGCLEVIKWLKENNCDTTRVVYNAISHNRINILKWMYKMNYLRADSADYYFETAFKSGQLDMVKWMLKKYGTRLKSSHCYALASAHKHLHILQWLKAKNCPVNKFKFKSYLEREFMGTYHLDVVALSETKLWLKQNNFEYLFE
jgi:hypothetical protein